MRMTVGDYGNWQISCNRCYRLLTHFFLSFLTRTSLQLFLEELPILPNIELLLLPLVSCPHLVRFFESFSSFTTL